MTAYTVSFLLVDDGVEVDGGGRSTGGGRGRGSHKLHISKYKQERTSSPAQAAEWKHPDASKLDGALQKQGGLGATVVVVMLMPARGRGRGRGISDGAAPGAGRSVRVRRR